MSELSNAEIHAEIAKRVYPDAFDINVTIHSRCSISRRLGGRRSDINFDLLETNREGFPTQQAKASSLDVLVWLTNEFNAMCESALHGAEIDKVNELELSLQTGMESGDPCAAIFEAAKEVIS